MSEDIKINIPFEDAYKYFTDHPEEVRENYVVIAENVMTGFSMCLTESDDGLPSIVVLDEEDFKIYEETVISAQDTKVTCNMIVNDYLEAVEAVPNQDGFITIVPGEDPTLQMEIDQRENQLYGAMLDFLDTVFLYNDDCIEDFLGDDWVSELLNVFLETMAFDYGIPVYRPTIQETMSGDIVYVEYPYDESAVEAGLV